MNILDKNIFEILDSFGLPRPKSVFQVGASCGQEIDFFFAHGVLSGVFLEPLPASFQSLSDKCSGKNYVPVQAVALALDNQEVEFFVASNSGHSSSIFKPARHLITYPHVEFNEPVKDTGHRVDSLALLARAKHNSLPACFDLLFLDVQGAELEVLKGAVSQLQSGKYVFCEIGRGDGYEGEVGYELIINFLMAFNYRLLALEWDPITGYGNALFGVY